MCHGQELDLLYYWNDNGINLSGNVWSSWLSGNWCWFALSFVIGSFPRDPGTNGMTAPTIVQIYFPWCLEIIRKVAPITLARDLQISDLRVSTKRCNIWACPLLVLKLPHSSMKLTHAGPNRCQIVGRHQNT